MSEVQSALESFFEKHRIVFWYDGRRELREAFEALNLRGVEKIELANNEYGVKHRILRGEPGQKFLLYREEPEPAELDNWLLDVQLASGVFSADQSALWARELGLRQEFLPLVSEHAEFFRAAARREALRAQLSRDESHHSIRLKMLAVCAGTDQDAQLASILQALLSEAAQGREEKTRLVRRSGLDGFLFERLQVAYGYSSASPGMRDFAYTLLQASLDLALDQRNPLPQDALLFLKSWKNNSQHCAAFEHFSNEFAGNMGLDHKLHQVPPEQLLHLDTFSMVDKHILAGLVGRVAGRTISDRECGQIIRIRRSTHWFGTWRNIYEAVGYASAFFAELDLQDLTMKSIEDGFRKYQASWHRLDALYRNFVFHARAAGQQTLLEGLITRVENFYTNNFLLPLNDNFQKALDDAGGWSAAGVPMQNEFYRHWLEESRLSGNTVAVIVSDAFRYELGVELCRRIEQENKYTAELEGMLGMLPSYTQLGMAALLPHEQLLLQDDARVMVDGQQAAGTENRSKILAGALGGRATALRSEDFLAMSRDPLRDLFREMDVVYIYHNRVDAAGDALKTEGTVFEAAERALEEILSILKKFYSLSYTYALVTADHGFLYQDQALDENEYAGVEVKGEQITFRNRRFVLGRGLQENPSVQIFSAGQLGLAGDLQVGLPRSINRLRLQGSGSRFVHGGMALQEVVLPVITVHKKRTSDLGQVEVDVISSSTNTITARQLSVTLYQKEPVSAKQQARTLVVGLYGKDDTLLSDEKEMRFDFESENAREREVKQQFFLSSAADEYNHQTIYLRLRERVDDTMHYKVYKSVPYEIHLSFTGDFDF